MRPGDGMEIKSREQVLNILKVLARRKMAKGNEYLLLSSFIAVSPPLPLDRKWVWKRGVHYKHSTRV